GGRHHVARLEDAREEVLALAVAVPDRERLRRRSAPVSSTDQRAVQGPASALVVAAAPTRAEDLDVDVRRGDDAQAQLATGRGEHAIDVDGILGPVESRAQRRASSAGTGQGRRLTLEDP